MLLPSRRKSSGIYDRSKGGATLLQNLRSGGNVAFKTAQRGKKSSRIYDRNKGRATLLQNQRNGGNVASKPEKEQRGLRPEQGRGNVAAESAQRGQCCFQARAAGKKISRIYDRNKGRATLLPSPRSGRAT
jgi:hypothetical protein